MNEKSSIHIDPNVLVSQDRSQAERYMEVLTGSKQTLATFQTFAEGGPSEHGPRILHGTLDEHWSELVRLNEAGHGIFMMVNEGDGMGRRAENVVAVRALFTDDDGDGPTPKPSTDAAPPTMVVQSKRGPQGYWGLMADEAKEAFTPAQTALAKHFGTDPKVKDLPRVMRVPGFFHLKDRKNPFLVTVKEVRPVRYTVQQVLTAFPVGLAAANEPTMIPAKASVATPKVSNSLAVRRARAYLSKVPGAVEGQHGDDTTYRVACILARDFGLSADEAMILLREWNQKCSPPWSETDLTEKLNRAEKYATGEKGSKLDDEAEEFAGTEAISFVITLGNYYLRLPNGQWDLSAPLKKEPAKNHLRSLGVPEEVIKTVLAFGLMPLAHGIDCAPGEGSTFTRDGRLVINSYKPPRITPKLGTWPHIKAIMVGVTDRDEAGYVWLLNWMAYTYQNPGSRSMTAPVFQGQPGWGKTVLGLILAALIGEENTACISQADLEGQFNGHFATKLFVVADEVVNQESIRDSESILKKYITDPRIVANVKNTPQFEVVNRMSWWFTSNKLTPVKVESRHDRRYTVFAALSPVPEEHKAMTKTLFRADGSFTTEFEEEMAAFAHALATHPVDRSAAMTPLHNAAREALINAGRTSAELFLAEVEERGVEAVVREFYDTTMMLSPDRWDFGDDGVAIAAVYGAYRRFCEGSGMTPCKRERLGQEMRLFFPTVARSKASSDGKRVRVYKNLPRAGRSEA